MPGAKGKSGPLRNQNAKGNSGGRKGRSGPPRNQNANGNSGGGAPERNKNAVSHGVYSFLSTGELPAEVQPLVDQFAERLDCEISERFRDEPSFEVGCLRETCISHYAVAQLRARYASQKGLTPEQRDKFLHGFLTALDRRDSKVEAINKLTSKPDPWEWMDVPSGSEDESETA